MEKFRLDMADSDGIPIVLDLGQEFMTESMSRSCQLLKITQQVCPSNRPNNKPEMERLFRHLDLGLTAIKGELQFAKLKIKNASANSRSRN